MVRAGELDAAFVANSDQLGALDRVEIDDPSSCCVHPIIHLATQAEADWTDLEGLDYVDFHDSWAVRSINDEVCRSHGVHRRVRCTLDDIYTSQPQPFPGSSAR